MIKRTHLYGLKMKQNKKRKLKKEKLKKEN